MTSFWVKIKRNCSKRTEVVKTDVILVGIPITINLHRKIQKNGLQILGLAGCGVTNPHRRVC